MPAYHRKNQGKAQNNGSCVRESLNLVHWLENSGPPVRKQQIHTAFLRWASDRMVRTQIHHILKCDPLGDRNRRNDSTLDRFVPNLSRCPMASWTPAARWIFAHDGSGRPDFLMIDLDFANIRLHATSLDDDFCHHCLSGKPYIRAAVAAIAIDTKQTATK